MCWGGVPEGRADGEVARALGSPHKSGNPRRPAPTWLALPAELLLRWIFSGCTSSAARMSSACIYGADCSRLQSEERLIHTA